MDVLVVGGGVIGLTVAIELKRRDPNRRILVIEKEEACGRHASGRNSGVLHAGFYYGADSLKARFTREGNRRLAAYCAEHGIAVLRCGKLVVARDAGDLAGLDELLRRGSAAGVELEELSEDEARAIEPRARTHERALFSPTTAVVDPAAVMASIAKEARRNGIAIETGVAFRRRRGQAVETSAGPISPGYLINAAGLYADAIAHQYGMGERYTLLPFKGVYLKAKPGVAPFRTHIYPVPDLRYPFLGVHFTVMANGGVKVGPTAIPALWREQYSGFANYRMREFASIVARQSSMLLTNRMGFRTLARREFAKYSKRRLLSLASELTNVSFATDGWNWAPAGIRAQLFDRKEGKLAMDFRIEGDEKSFHVLNAVSPAFTSAFPFAEFVVDEIEARPGSRMLSRTGVSQS